MNSLNLLTPSTQQRCHSAPSRQAILLRKCHTANKFVNSRRFGLDQATVQLSAAVMIHGDSGHVFQRTRRIVLCFSFFPRAHQLTRKCVGSTGARVMRTITVLCLILIGLASTPAFSSPLRPGPGLFDQIVPRPPRGFQTSGSITPQRPCRGQNRKFGQQQPRSPPARLRSRRSLRWNNVRMIDSDA